MNQPLPDILDSNIKLLFIGFNPSLTSGVVGHNYANPSNRFWKILKEANITERQLKPEEDITLLKEGIGFTNIVDRPTKTAAELTKQEFIEGRNKLIEKIKLYNPAIVCFVGKGVYVQYSLKRNIKWGMQTDSVVQGVIEFVAPSSSGLVRMKLDEVIDIYKDLTKLWECYKDGENN
ncbi:G/U mismatch-specific DNA glycosylase [Bacillus sp. HMF5848]|uniref:G/U mismatch-specific DNA glycosylase n=1 Tax=Bacillus sp. HMF5848 TaxID=2495421 RepID=UPI000F7B646E|nr:G/U mismatch-specific DNA glycosylase [Bacillus sp. HMF5848]RSK27266.1 G/U mismatch-specific DNA glycosylase [Bacillus sp. HMF5848]